MCPKAAIVEACSLVWILTGAGSLHCWPKLAKEHSLRTVHPNDHSVGHTAACAVFAYLCHQRKLCSLAATLAKALVICSKFWRKVYWRKARNTCMLSGKNTGSDKIFFYNYYASVRWTQDKFLSLPDLFQEVLMVESEAHRFEAPVFWGSKSRKIWRSLKWIWLSK